MITHTLPPPSARSTPPPLPARPDVAFATLPLLRRLRRVLPDALRFRNACRAVERRRRWGVPELFFFDADIRAEWEGIRPSPQRIPAALADTVARRDPAAAQAWQELDDLVTDALTVLSASVEARHAARTDPGLVAATKALAADHRRCRCLLDLLTLADDEIIRVIHPAARAGFRVWVRGVADIYQLHALLTDGVTGDPARGLLPGPRPDPQVLTAYQRGPIPDPEPVAYARFQLYRLSALQPDGTLPAGFAGSDHWLWGSEAVTSVLRVDGERVILLGEPVYRRSWAAIRKVPWVVGELEVVEVLSAAEVTDWLSARTGQPLAPPRLRRAA